jgi:DNA-binding LacI/PurR family transcriptional regulator
VTSGGSRADLEPYPTDHVYAVIDDAEGARDAVEALLAVGHASEDVTLLCGPQGLELLDPDGSRHGRVGRVIRTVQNFGPEREQLRQIEDELGRGHFAVGVHVVDAAQKDQAAGLLLEHGGHYVHHYGPWVIERIAP